MDVNTATNEELRNEVKKLTGIVESLRAQNAHLRDENSKLLIDIAFFDGKFDNKRSNF